MTMVQKAAAVGLGTLLGLAGVALAQTEAAKKLTKHSSISYRLEIATEGEKPVVFEYKDQAGKARLTVHEQKQGQENVMEMIQTPDGFYMLNPREKTAVKFLGKNNPMASMMFPFMWMVVEPEWSTYLAARQQGYSFSEKGSETVRGQKCAVKEIVNTQTKEKVWLYVSEDGVIRRWVVFPHQGQPKKSTMDLIFLEFDQKIPDSTFQVPAGMQVTDMGAMPFMPGMGQPGKP